MYVLLVVVSYFTIDVLFYLLFLLLSCAFAVAYFSANVNKEIIFSFIITVASLFTHSNMCR